MDSVIFDKVHVKTLKNNLFNEANLLCVNTLGFLVRPLKAKGLLVRDIIVLVSM